jgi:two-component system nitrate/nitrite response regulator NarL
MMEGQLSENPGQDIRVAILEDHRLMREGLAELLQRQGLKVVATAGDVDLFMQRIGGLNPDVVLIDLAIEGPTGTDPLAGLAVLRELRQYHPSVRPLVLSATRDPAVIDECLKEGAWGYLDKQTTSYESVIKTIQAIARGERMVSLPMFQGSIRPVDTSGTGSTLISSLTMREREVLAYVAAGADNLKIASHLKISERTVKAHVSSLYKKLGPENRAQLALLARQLGIRPPVDV